jgi:hypothetical protein
MTRCARPVSRAAAAAVAATVIAIKFVCTHVRHALQQTAAVGACSPYFAAASAARPAQIVFTV